MRDGAEGSQLIIGMHTMCQTLLIPLSSVVMSVNSNNFKYNVKRYHFIETMSQT
jgi:hypothetical protein